ncbi:bifunctional histidinol-phosphatase/imidazoleglycerol-phosphate dehydratase HisB [Candidatus Peregrinibacteria bacterium]|nr:bifunctional histidinol-phosphatase/imidazoleglycerol-phosphate dehydratase HisB [Candidatus Peregrinibacteria bacterium]
MKIAFLDRDGTLIYEPPDTKRIDSIEKLQILPGVFEGLKKLRAQGYRLVMISNQDGVGTRAFPKKNFEKPQKEFLKRLAREGIEFYKIFICPHIQKDNCGCRKPEIGLVESFIKKINLDKELSLMVGDRETDEAFGGNIGIKTFRMETNSRFPRIGAASRKTSETSISIAANLDGNGKFQIDTGLNFFNHMLEQFSKHSLIDLFIKARGDLQIDEHHTVEDTALVLGEALNNGLGARKGIRRYGFLLPMDDTLAEVAMDLGGRQYLVFNADFKREKVGDLPTEMVEHFFKSLSDALRANIHISVRYGKNEHHKIEAIFKAFGKTMRQAAEKDPRLKDTLPSTKGIL